MATATSWCAGWYDVTKESGRKIPVFDDKYVSLSLSVCLHGQGIVFYEGYDY